ncbi:CHAT domain-containing protein [Variovorax gossypii]|uniref:CHAT domain-containing protein n=1 Tax=Variovorax gossypii TaxID=1679495 RepID=UPI00197F69B7|nr:CHAT domain-containing protein [Variovorax gossypii]
MLSFLFLVLPQLPAHALVDMKNANYSHTWIDIAPLREEVNRFWSEEYLLNLGVQRTYNSRSLHDGVFGFGWCTDIETKLDFFESGVVQLTHCGGGQQRRFGAPQVFDGVERRLDDMVTRLRMRAEVSGTFKRMLSGRDDRHWLKLRETLLEDEYLDSNLAKSLGRKRPDLTGQTLAEMGVGDAALVFHKDEIRLISAQSPMQLIFDRSGRLIGLRHQDGRRIEITYDADKPVRVQNEEGHELILTYSENGKITSVRRQLKGETTFLLSRYRHNRDDDLIEVENAWIKTYRYRYNARHNLTRAEWPDKTAIHLYYDDRKDWVISFQDREECIENYTYVTPGREHYSSQVLKRCRGTPVASNFYEFWHAPSADGRFALQRVRTFVAQQITEIDYEQVFGLPIRISKDGIVTTYENSSAGRVKSRVSGDTKWVFGGDSSDTEGVVVLEETVRSDGEPEVTRHKTDPWGALYTMPAVERQRQRAIQAASVEKANEAVARFNASSEHMDRQLDRWHEMRAQRRFESAVALARTMDAELRDQGEAALGRANVAQLALVLADELASTDSADISLALAKFVLEVSPDVESIDVARAGLLVDQLSRQSAKPQQAIAALRVAIAILKRRATTPPAETMLQLHLALATAEREAGNPKLALEALREVSSSSVGASGAAIWPKEGVEEVAVIYSQAGLYELALETLLQSRIVFLSLVDPYQEWTSDDGDGEYSGFSALGIVEEILRAQGRFDDALAINKVRVQRLFKGLPPSSPSPNASYARLLEAEVLTLTYAGQYAAASQLMEKSFWHAAGNDSVRARLLSTRALLSSRLGMYAEAVNDGREAIRLAGDHMGDDAANLASSLSELGRHDESEAAFDATATDAARRLPGVHPRLADLRVRWAEARLRAGNPGGAVQLLNGANDNLQAALSFSHWRVTRSLVTRAEAAIELRDVEGATLWATRALSSAYAGGLPEWRSAADHTMSRALALAGSSSLAIFFAKRAVNELQHVRSQLSGLDAQSQVSLMKARHVVFENATALLIDAGRLGEAQQVLSMYKLDELQQFTQRSGPGEDPRNVRAEVDGVETRWQAAIDLSAARFGAVSAELSKLEALGRLDSLTAPQRRRWEQLRDFVDDEQRSFGRTLDAIRREAPSADAESAGATARSAVPLLRASVAGLSELSKRSGSRVVALQYVVLDKKIYILVTTPELQFSREVSLEGQQLGQLVQSFREAVQDTRADPSKAGGRLYELLVRPIAAALKEDGADTLMVSLTGVLRYVPFAALHDGSRYLVERYRIALMSEAAPLMGMQPPRPNWNVAGLGVSAKVDPDFLELPSVRKEIAAVVRGASGMSSGVLPGVAWIDGEFTAERLQSVLSDAPAVIHVASHFKFSPGSDTRSFLLLGDGTRLTLRDLAGSRYRFQSSDLLTLSACETGVGGGRDLAGREIEGLALLAQQQGASAVLATLWPVADPSTAQFMQRFYTLRQDGKTVSKSEALQRAQLEMLRGGGNLREGMTSASFTSPRQYSHPYFWAPFILLGNWL